MNMVEAIRKAVETRDPSLAAAVTDKLRGLGWRHDEIEEAVRYWTGVSPAKWEALLYEADALD